MRTFIHRSIAAAIAVCLLQAGPALAQKRIRPGFNLFSPAQDIQLGKEASAEIEKQVSVVKDKKLTAYVAKIGQRLAAVAQGEKYPYAFKVVADPSINAFALPGGPIYVHTGLITAADNEAQLAGVMAHEVAHVTLRHSTNRATKAQIFQIPLVLAGGMLEKKGGILGALSQIGIGFGVNSIFMKYSRNAEKQADIVGARMMAEVGYDPVEMAAFFQKLEETGGARGPQFFSDHPNPGNRVHYISEEVELLPKRSYTKGSAGLFRAMKARAAKIKAPPKKKADAESLSGAGKTASGPAGAGATAASGRVRFRGSGYEFVHPADWRAYAIDGGATVTVIPANGLVTATNGSPTVARGAMAGYFPASGRSLGQKTNELLADLRRSSPELAAVPGQRRGVRFGALDGESLLLRGRSPLGNQSEAAWLVVNEQRKGLFYMLFVAPGNEYEALRVDFQNMVQTAVFD